MKTRLVACTLLLTGNALACDALLGTFELEGAEDPANNTIVISKTNGSYALVSRTSADAPAEKTRLQPIPAAQLKAEFNTPDVDLRKSCGLIMEGSSSPFLYLHGKKPGSSRYVLIVAGGAIGGSEIRLSKVSQ